MYVFNCISKKLLPLNSCITVKRYYVPMTTHLKNNAFVFAFANNHWNPTELNQPVSDLDNLVGELE